MVTASTQGGRLSQGRVLGTEAEEWPQAHRASGHASTCREIPCLDQLPSVPIPPAISGPFLVTLCWLYWSGWEADPGGQGWEQLRPLPGSLGACKMIGMTVEHCSCSAQVCPEMTAIPLQPPFPVLLHPSCCSEDCRSLICLHIQRQDTQV